MTPPVLPARFPARRLLKVVSLSVGGLALGLLIAIVVLSVVRSESVGAEGVWVIVPVLLLPAGYVLKLINDSFSVLEVNESDLRVRRCLGGTVVPWETVGSVRYWETIQVVYGARSREYFLEVLAPGGKRLLRLKSTYERPAYGCILDAAKARAIRVDSV